MLKLSEVTISDTPRIQGLRPGGPSIIDFAYPPAALIGWRVLVRGTLVFLASPPGWTKTTSTEPHRRDKNGPRVIFRIDGNVHLTWHADTDADIEAAAKRDIKFDSEPLGGNRDVASAQMLLPLPAHAVGD